MNRERIARLVIVWGLLLLPAAAWAQTLGSGSIAGVVKDTSGAVLPGVTVEAASPALIEKVRTVVTDDQGVYKIVDLRPGSYVVTFSLTGFSTVRREGIELTTAFTATVNAELKVGALEETITVSGQAPVVDTQNVMQQRVLARDTLDAIPTGKNTTQYATLIPGAVLSSPTGQDVGGTQGEQSGTFSIHGGRANDINLHQDGMMLNILTGGGNTTWSFNRASTEEVSVQTGGITAESAYGGVQVNIVPKEGGNRFSGHFSTSYSDKNLQAGNLTPELRDRGLSSTPSAKKIYDLSLALGGPIKKDKLWFFTAHRWWGSSQYQAGNYFNATQDSWFYTADLSRPAFTNDYYQDNSVRFTWQASQKNKVNVSYAIQDNCNCYHQLLTRTASPEAVGAHLYSPNYALQATWSYPATNRLLLEAGATLYFNRINANRQPEVSLDHIGVTELSTNYAYRARAVSVSPPGSYGKHDAHQINEKFAVSYITGSHAFKTGIFLQEAWKYFFYTWNGGVDYSFRNRVPVQVRQWAQPLFERERTLNTGLFAQDQWTIQRLTLNLGVRYDSLNGYVPEQHLPAGPLVPARDFAAVENVPSWKDIAPRVGAAYDLFGNGKTAVKVFLGRYVGLESLNGFVSLNNPVNRMANVVTRPWGDTNGNFVPDCDLKNPASNLECGPMSDAAFGQLRITTRYADDVLSGLRRRTSNWQASASFQHELRPGIALNVGYFRTWYNNFTVTDNQLLAPTDFDSYCFTAPANAKLPGGGSERICGLYDFKPSKAGQVDNLVTQASNYGKQSEVFNGVDATINARFGQGGQLSGGLSVGRTVTDNCFVVDSPQQRFCHVSAPWSAGTQVKFLVVYPLPLGLQTSATYQNLPGIPITASYVASNAEIAPTLGRNLGACGTRVPCTATATIELIQPNRQFEDRITQLDFRLTRIFRVGPVKLQGNFDVYNVLNTSPILSMITRYGPAWLRPTQVLAGRLFKFGVQLNY